MVLVVTAPNRADDYALLAAYQMRRVAKPANPVANVFDLIFSRIRAHCYDHYGSLLDYESQNPTADRVLAARDSCQSNASALGYEPSTLMLSVISPRWAIARSM